MKSTSRSAKVQADWSLTDLCSIDQESCRRVGEIVSRPTMSCSSCRSVLLCCATMPARDHTPTTKHAGIPSENRKLPDHVLQSAAETSRQLNHLRKTYLVDV